MRKEKITKLLKNGTVISVSTLAVAGLMVGMTGEMFCEAAVNPNELLNTKTEIRENIPVIVDGKNDTSELESVLEIQINENEVMQLGITEDARANRGNYSRKTKSNSELKQSSVINSNDTENLSSLMEEAKEQKKIQAELARQEQVRKQQEEARKQLERKQLADSLKQYNNGALLSIDFPDPNYNGTALNITGQDRETLERLVMGEAGGQGFAGAALVAQCLRDVMVTDGIPTVEQARVQLGYTGRLDKEPNEDVKKAVAHVFDNGGYAVKHRIIYFYSPAGMSNGVSSFHETQNLVIEYGGHRVFDRVR